MVHPVEFISILRARITTYVIYRSPSILMTETIIGWDRSWHGEAKNIYRLLVEIYVARINVEGGDWRIMLWILWKVCLTGSAPCPMALLP